MGIRPVEAPSSSILVREQMVLEDQSEWVRGQGGSCVADIIEARAEKKGQDVLDCRSRLDALQARSLQSISISYPTISGRGPTHLRCCTTDGIGTRPRAICVHHRDTRHLRVHLHHYLTQLLLQTAASFSEIFAPSHIVLCSGRQLVYDCHDR